MTPRDRRRAPRRNRQPRDCLASSNRHPKKFSRFRKGQGIRKLTCGGGEGILVGNPPGESVRPSHKNPQNARAAANRRATDDGGDIGGRAAAVESLGALDLGDYYEWFGTGGRDWGKKRWDRVSCARIYTHIRVGGVNALVTWQAGVVRGGVRTGSRNGPAVGGGGARMNWIAIG
jgi:hypothetical protein